MHKDHRQVSHKQQMLAQRKKGQGRSRLTADAPAIWAQIQWPAHLSNDAGDQEYEALSTDRASSQIAED